jgi:hypothetical protein
MWTRRRVGPTLNGQASAMMVIVTGRAQTDQVPRRMNIYAFSRCHIRLRLRTNMMNF